MLRGRPVQKWSHTTSGQEGGNSNLPRDTARASHIPLNHRVRVVVRLSASVLGGCGSGQAGAPPPASTLPLW